jgi:hypothetical protein
LLSEHLVQELLGLVFVAVLRKGQLGNKDLASLGEHPLLTRGQALVLVPLVETANYLGDLIDVSRAELLDVGFEPARPVRGVGRLLLLAKDLEDLAHLLLGSDLAQAHFIGGIGRDHEGELAVRELQDEVLALFAEEFLPLHALDHGCPVVWIDDLVTYAETHYVCPPAVGRPAPRSGSFRRS